MNSNVQSTLVSEVWSWAKTIGFAVVFALFITNFVIVNASVPTGSMEDNIKINDRIVAFRLSYMLSEPERFDIVVFRFPDDERELYVKRIIGLPGERVDIRDGKVYINGSDTPLDDSFCKETPTGNFGPYIVPEGYYFMLGDNRNTSKDSRYWDNTYLSEKKMLGKAIFRYYPSIGLLN